MSKKRTLITGAAGFIGGHVTRMLLEEGRRVRAFIRPGEELTNLEALGELGDDVERVEGDIRDAAAVAAAMKGCDRVYHLAAIYALWMENPDVLWDVNVQGTRVVCQAALDAGVERMVYTSSIAAIGILPGETPANEDTPYNYWTANDYIEVQKHFWKLSRQLRVYLSALFSLFMTAILFQMFPECLDELSEAGRTVIPPLVWLHFFVLYTLFLNLVREVGIRLALHLEAPPQETLYYQLGQHTMNVLWRCFNSY